MRRLAEFDAINFYSGRHSCYRISYFDYLSVKMIAGHGVILSYYRRNTGFGAGVLAGAMILASSTMRDAARFFSKGEAHPKAPPHGNVEQAFERDISCVRGVSNATAS